MKRAISHLFAFLVFVVGAFGIYNAQAQGLTFSTGEKLSHNLSVCMNKDDAIAILNAHKDGGKEAAQKKWLELAGCDNVVINGFHVGKVVYAVRVGDVVASAVEILGQGKVVAYFITTHPVNKPQNKA